VAVRENLKKYGDMINGMLELAKIDGDNSKISNINVHDYISQYIASQKSDKTINIDVNDKLKIRFPENHFRIILSNLLSNALKYGEKSKPINVSFLVNSTGHLVVENEAKNVNKADLKKIWKRFSRLKNADDIDGYGIGLSVVKEITDFHKLTISSKLTGENVVKISIGGFEVV
jgi:signal transduction histidine kinase